MARDRAGEGEEQGARSGGGKGGRRGGNSELWKIVNSDQLRYRTECVNSSVSRFGLTFLWKFPQGGGRGPYHSKIPKQNYIGHRQKLSTKH